MGQYVGLLDIGTMHHQEKTVSEQVVNIADVGDILVNQEPQVLKIGAVSRKIHDAHLGEVGCPQAVVLVIFQGIVHQH